MPSGVAAPSVLSIEEAGVSELQDVAIPLPNDPAWMLTPVAFEALFTALADPRPDWFESLGFRGPMHDLAMYDRIHVSPRRRDLGAGGSEQEIDVEVWNAFLA